MAKAKKIAQTNSVKLSKKGTTQTIEFDIAHALRLLKMTNAQWVLNDDKFEFDGNEIKRFTSKTADKQPAKSD